MNRLVGITCIGLLCALLTTDGLAQSNARNEVINAEYQFAATASETNTREAFLSHLAPHGLIVQQGELVNAIETWKSRKPNPSVLLSWYPSFVDVAPSGDLALSTGPWEWKKSRQDSSASAFGHFVSIWKRQSDGGWKVVIDIGTSHPAPAQKETPLSKSDQQRGVNVELMKGNGLRSNAELIEREKTLTQDYSKVGPKAVINGLADNATIYRPGSAPMGGKEASEMLLKEAVEKHVYSVVGAELSQSGDWGYAYGSVVFKSVKGTEVQSSKAAYMRVWKKGGGQKWEIILEVITI